MIKTSKRLLLLCLATTALAVPAQAGDVPAVVDVILQNIERQTQSKPTYESIETDGSGTITITNLSMAPKAADGGGTMTFTMGSMTLEDVSEEDDGLYDIGSATFSNVKAEMKGTDGQGFVAEMPEGSAEDWYIKDAGGQPTAMDAMRASMTVAKKMSSGKITVTAMGQTFTTDGYESTWDGDLATGAGTFSTKISNVVIPEEALAAIDPSNTLKQLGYSGLTFDISGDGTFSIDGDNMGLDMNFAYAGKDMGALKFSISASDIPVAIYGELQKAQTTGKEPDFSALMPQLQNVSFGGFTFRFEDASITKKLLPMAAAMQGMDEAAMVANAGAMIQMGLMQLNNQDFTNQVVGAVNAFLKDPKSLTIALKPAAPVKVQELMTLNPADPNAAITKLGVSVTAND